MDKYKEMNMKSKAIEIKGCTDNNIMLEYMTGTPKFYRKIVDKINNCYILGHINPFFVSFIKNK